MNDADACVFVFIGNYMGELTLVEHGIFLANGIFDGQLFANSGCISIKVRLAIIVILSGRIRS